MKILLADDERMVRLGLINMLDELSPLQHTYEQATNGKQMLTAVEAFLPDIAFVDIKMPLMSGLEALEKCVALSPGTQFLVLSGYSEFEYARKAMVLGAQEYLLKPVSLEVLDQAVRRAAEQIQRRCAEENAAFSHQIAAIASEEDAGFAVGLSAKYKAVRAQLFCMDCWDEKRLGEAVKSVAEALHGELTAQIAGGGRYSVQRAGPGEIFLVSAGDISTRRAIAAASVSGLAVTGLDCKEAPVGELAEWRRAMAQDIRARVLYGYGRITSYDESYRRRAVYFAPLSAEVSALCAAFRRKDELSYRNTLHGIGGSGCCEMLFRETPQECLAVFLRDAIGFGSCFGSFRELLAKLEKHTEQMYQAGRPAVESDQIEWVQAYICENYMNDISAAAIAGSLKLSPNYFSKIFHDRVGSKFIDYLTQVRIINAKRIMSENPRLTVRDVAEMVGYISTRHFTKTFSRLTGCLPSEYLTRGMPADKP